MVKANEKKSAFSPLQTGCAFLMLTNMLIYLAIVAFVFNMLDSSKLSEAYVKERGTLRESKSDDSSADRKQSASRPQAEHREIISRPRLNESSAAKDLSRLGSHTPSAGRTTKTTPPVAGLTRSPGRSYYGSTGQPKSRAYSIEIYPQATLSRQYHPRDYSGAKNIAPERYDSISVKLAPGIEIPVMNIPSGADFGADTYEAQSPYPAPLKNSLKISVPPRGASSIETNRTESPASGTENSPAKD